MTLLWLFIWWVNDTPKVDFSGDFLTDWNNWAIFLVIAVFCDLTSGGRVTVRRQ